MRFLVYVECGTLGDIDDALGPSVDGNLIDKYAVLFQNETPIFYQENQDSAADFLNQITAKLAKSLIERGEK
jgi:hypothetical protein